MNELIKISIDEFITNFSDWIKNIERKNLILYHAQDDMIVFTFKNDFQFLCVATLDELKKYYSNERMNDKDVMNTFIEEFFKDNVIQTKGVLKYII